MVRKKKAALLKRHGRLACEVCGFDFAEIHGEVGEPPTLALLALGGLVMIRWSRRK